MSIVRLRAAFALSRFGQKLHMRVREWSKRCFPEAAAFAYAPHFHYALGSLYLEQGDDQKSIAHFAMAAQGDPNNVMAWRSLCYLLALFGDYHSAYQCIEEARQR